MGLPQFFCICTRTVKVCSTEQTDTLTHNVTGSWSNSAQGVCSVQNGYAFLSSFVFSFQMNESSPPQQYFDTQEFSFGCFHSDRHYLGDCQCGKRKSLQQMETKSEGGKSSWGRRNPANCYGNIINKAYTSMVGRETPWRPCWRQSLWGASPGLHTGRKKALHTAYTPWPSPLTGSHKDCSQPVMGLKKEGGWSLW